MVFRRLERMLYETGLYFGVPCGAVAGIYEMIKGAGNCEGLSEAILNPQFQMGAGIYVLANAAGWLLNKSLNRSVIKENKRRLEDARAELDYELKASSEKAHEKTSASMAEEPEKTEG